MSYGTQIIYAADLEEGHKIVQVIGDPLIVYKVVRPSKHGGYLFAWVSRTQAVPYNLDDLVRVEV